MPTINSQKFERELKKGGAELLVLSLLESRPRHGYEVRKLIETRSDGALKFNAASLYLLLYRLEKRGRNRSPLGGETGEPAGPFLKMAKGRKKVPGRATQH